MSGGSADQIRELREQVRAIEREEKSGREAVSSAIGDTIDQVAATAEGAAQKVNATYETAADTLRAHPFAAMLGAAVVGFVFGRARR